LVNNSNLKEQSSKSQNVLKEKPLNKMDPSFVKFTPKPSPRQPSGSPPSLTESNEQTRTIEELVGTPLDVVVSHPNNVIHIIEKADHQPNPDTYPPLVKKVLHLGERLIELKKATFSIDYNEKLNKYYIHYQEISVDCCRSKHFFTIDVSNPTYDQVKFIDDLEKKIYDDTEFEKIKNAIKAGCSLKNIIEEGDEYIKKYYNPTENKSISTWKRRGPKIYALLVGCVSATAFIIGVVQAINRYM
jgi:hypothetical protein